MIEQKACRHFVIAAILASLPVAFAWSSTEDGEVFEKEIRPLLIENCGKCHGAEKQRAGLRIDSRKALLEGGESGPSLVPGHPDKSLLISAIRQSGELRMPPGRKLRDDQIATLERWVAAGAPWPADLIAGQNDDVRRRHWAFQPVVAPIPPTVRRPDWCRTPIDAFILSRLEAAGLEPSPPADRRALIRRASYDLTGLPPSPAEVDAFVADPDPSAFARVVDRLLASEQHGEQWARHWLDVARYSDTKGYVYAREERFFVQAPAYRDWVVKAFNDDMPYDRFLRLQVAADQVAPGDRSALAAMGFLTMGRRFLGVTRDIIDDRIDVLTRGTMGLTVGCARCHDHKFDPIPTADYYSLYGVFQNCVERLEPIADLGQTDAPTEAFRVELDKRREALRSGLASSRAEASRRVRERVTDYLMAQRDLKAIPEEGFDVVVGKGDVVPAFVRRWKNYLDAASKVDDPIFRPWRRFAGLRDDEFASRAAEVTLELRKSGSPALNPLIAKAFAEPTTSIREVAGRYGKLFAEVDRQWRELRKASSPEVLPDADAESLRQVLHAPSSPCEVPDEPIVSSEWFFDTDTIVAMWKLQGDVDRWLIQSPMAPPHAVTLVDRNEMREARIFRRGNPANQGDEVSRHFLSVIAGPHPKPYTQGSGRLELARAITDPTNPLTARVWVNRVWLHHFGSGLVRTPSDFGLRAEPPSHPELLDWLARRLVDEGWSTKALHRMILLSSTYQQTSAAPVDSRSREQALRVDPENRLLWRMNPRRLTFEEARDTLLAASGELDRRVGGRAAELFPAGGTNVRRTLYGLVDRQFLSSVLRIFDFANPDLHIPLRSETTVPQQALFALNHPFLAGRAKALAARVRGTDPSEAIRQLYRASYQREPTAAQIRVAQGFLDSATQETRPTPAPETLAWSYGYGAVDAAADRVENFRPLPHFNGSAWGGGPKWPDPTLGWVQLTAQGGHAGNDLQHAAIRRWTSPGKATVAIRSTASHEVAAGDGIRCWVISSRRGVLKSAEVHNTKIEFDAEPVEVEAGDTIDFVVDFREGLNSDQYLWSPKIRELGPASTANWDATRDFVGPTEPRLTPLEQLAQVLLMANESMFVD
jgi:mono/diheme cytochrome c family protein